MSSDTEDSAQRLGVLNFGDVNVELPSEYRVRHLELTHENNKVCKHCGARFWKEETINCCNNGKVVVHRLKPLPEGVFETFSQRHFKRRQRSYNSTFAFTALGASPGPTWTQPAYPSYLKLHARPYHRIMDAFRDTYEGSATNNSRMYIYDSDLQSRASALKLDEDTVTFIAEKLRNHNSWVTKYRALLLEIDQSGEDNMNISFEETSRVKPSTNTEIAAILYRDSTKIPGQRHVYTYPRNGPKDECDKPRFVPIWSATYLPLQYPLLYFSGESGWSPGNWRDGRKSKTLSTTGNPVENFYYSRQRLLIEPAFHVLSAVAQEFAVDQYVCQT